MNTRTGSTLKAFLEYLGRGATPVDGYHWADVAKVKASGIETKIDAVEKNDCYWAKVAADSALVQPRKFIYPTSNC